MFCYTCIMLWEHIFFYGRQPYGDFYQSYLENELYPWGKVFSVFFVLLFFLFQTSDIIEYLRRLSKTTIPDGIIQFIKVQYRYCNFNIYFCWCRKL